MERWGDYASRTDENITADMSVTATFALNTYTLTYLAGDNGSITGTAVQTVNHDGDGTQVTAVANEGYYFTGWSDGVTTASRTDENITSDLSVTATFALIDKYYVTLVSSPSLAGVLSGEGEYADGAQAAVSAVANTGYTFINWTLDGVVVSEGEDYTFEVTENTTLTANFALNTYTLTYLADDNGNISGTAIQTVNHGGDGTQVTAVANEGYHFVQWSDGVTTASRTDENLTADLTVTAQFARTTYTLTIHNIGKGQVTVNGLVYTEPVTASVGASLIIKAMADEGSFFRGWKGQFSSEKPEETIFMDKDRILLAIFSAHVPLSDIKIFPNPFTDQFSLNATGLSSVTLTDIKGSQVYRVEPFGDKEIEIRTADLAPGVYFITIETKSGEKLLRKVVKSH